MLFWRPRFVPSYVASDVPQVTVVSGPWASIEATDIAAFNAAFAIQGPWISIETTDIAAFNATLSVTGPWATLEAQDTAAFNATLSVTGPWATLEAQDTAAFNATLAVTGPWASIETSDVAAFIGSVPLSASGALGAIETADALQFTINYIPPTPVVMAARPETKADYGWYVYEPVDNRHVP